MSTSSDGVLEFLASVHSADEQAAREALDSGRADEWTAADPLIDHVARHDPQSVLARVEAERQMSRIHGPDYEWAEHADNWVYCLTCVVDHDNVRHPCPTLRVLAWGYRGREGFDPAWTPDARGSTA